MSERTKTNKRLKQEQRKRDRRSTAVHKWINGLKGTGIPRPTKNEIECFKTGWNMAWSDGKKKK